METPTGPYNSALAVDYWSAAAITDDSGTNLEYEQLLPDISHLSRGPWS
jgi:hypothetical protein